MLLSSFPFTLWEMTGFSARLFLSILLIALRDTDSLGQWRDIRFDEIGQEDGYLARGVNDMVQDRLGYMYFATEMGLLRYDGSAFEYFQYEPDDSLGISEGKVSCITIDQDGFLWMGMNGVVDRFDPRRGVFTHFTIAFTNDRGIKIQVPVSSLLDDDDRLWVSGGDFSLHLLHKSTGQLETFYPENPDPVHFSDRSAFGIHRILKDKHQPGILWLGVNDLGLVRFDIDKKQFLPTSCSLTYPWQDTDGKLWSGSWENGLIQYNPNTSACTQEPIQISIPNVSSKISPPTHDVIRYNDKIWLGAPHGIIAFDTHGSQRALYYDKENDNIFRFYKDHSGNIWIGPFGGSIKIFNPAAQHIDFFSINTFEPTERYYPSWQIYDAFKNRVLAVHGWRNKLYSIDMDREHPTQNKMIDVPVNIRGIIADKNNTIWVAGFSSLYKLNPTNDRLEEFKSASLKKVESPSISTWQLGTDVKGNLTLLGYFGFIYYDVGKDTAFRISIDRLHDETTRPEIFWSHSVDHEGNIWLTTESVIARFNPDDGSFMKFTPILRGRSSRFRSTVADKQGNIWLIGNTLEQYRLDDDSLRHIRSVLSPVLPKNLSGVHLHIDSNGRIWSFGQSGIHGIDPSTLEVRNFDLYDGLDNMYLDPLQSVSLPDGAILTHGGTGVMRFHPDSLWHTGDPPHAEIVIKNIRISGFPYSDTLDVNYISSIDLDPDDDFVDIHYRAIALPRPRKVTYSYKVEGLSDDWIFHGSNETVTLTNLAPGKYIFYVKTGLPDSDTPVKRLDVFVAKPFYLQTWFLLFAIGGIAGLIYLMYQLRINRIRREEALKTDFNKKIAEVELQALRAQMNPHFMFNSLNSVKSYILKSGPLEAAEYLTNFSSLIRSILDNSREKQISLHKELEALLLYIDLEKMRFPDKFNFVYSISGHIPLHDIMIPPLILQPFVENAIWHGLLHKETKGTLGLTIQNGDHQVECIIEDDGIGRNLAMELKKKSPRRFKSMGMGITRDRIELHNKLNDLGISVEIIDKEDENGNALGTKVIIHFPTQHTHA